MSRQDLHGALRLPRGLPNKAQPCRVWSLLEVSQGARSLSPGRLLLRPGMRPRGELHNHAQRDGVSDLAASHGRVLPYRLVSTKLTNLQS